MGPEPGHQSAPGRKHGAAGCFFLKRNFLKFLFFVIFFIFYFTFTFAVSFVLFLFLFFGIFKNLVFFLFALVLIYGPKMFLVLVVLI